VGVPSARGSRLLLLLLLPLPLLPLEQQRRRVLACCCGLQLLQNPAERVVQLLLLPPTLGVHTCVCSAYTAADADTHGVSLS
jgi:hypothetical protein